MVTTKKKAKGIATSPGDKNNINDDVIIAEKDEEALTNDELDTTETVASANFHLNQAIAPQHLEEWRKSAVNEEIIRANVRTIYDQLEVDRLLNKRTKKMWHRPNDLVPCWCATGVDPLTDMPTVQGVQVKPNAPRINEKGKAIKYEGARDAETAPLFLDTGKEGFWTNILEDVNQKIFICEGAKKAGALLSNNYAGVSIPGVTTCRKRGRLHQNLEIFAKVGRVFYLCFDNDILTKKPVQDALKGMGAVLKSFGSVVMVIQLPPGEFKGVDDYIAAFGAEAFQVLVDNAITIQEWVDEIKNQELEEEDILPNSRLARHYNLVKEKWGENLRYNSLKKQVELSGRELDEDEVRLTMAIKFDIDISSTDAQTVVRSLAKEDEYSPVVEYLDEIGNKYPSADTQFLDGLAKQYFGSDDPIHATYFKKFLVAAVARARQPGCKVDSVFMLMSPQQGKYKSTFFSVLFGEEFFSDQLGTDIGNKDEKMKISQYWCLEWAEFEAIYRRKDVSALKNFITNREDTFRAPYARKDMKHPRPCVFVGTSNEKEILHDPTGDRRFWIVPVTIDKIPLSQVRSDRDKVWAAADALYRSGFQWWLKDEEELIRAEQNKEYQNTSYWDEVIEQLWIESLRPNFLDTETIVKRLGFENAKEMKPGDSNELNKSMTRLGFVKSKNPRRVNGVQKRGWEILENVERFDENDQKPVTGVTPLLCNNFSRYTPDTPPVTGVTASENIQLTVTPVTPHVTGVYQPEALQEADVTPIHPPGAFLQHFTTEEKKSEVETPVNGFESGNCAYRYGDVEKIDPADNAELLRICIHDQSWEMIAELTEQWTPEFKKTVWALLTQAERDAINNMKPAVEEAKHAPRPQSEIIPGCPHFQEGGVYFGAKNGQGKFKIKTIRTTKDEVVGILPGVPSQEITIQMINIVALKESPLTTLQVGDEVEILTGKRKGQKGVVERIDLCCWVKFPKSTTALSFYSHHLKKVD
jgi:predicted P-loop ATPase